MDAADRSILKVLAKNARASLKQLAQVAFLSSPAVSARVERLEKHGIIQSYQAHFNLAALGFPILAFVNIAIAPAQRPTFYQFLNGCSNVLECHHITGAYSMIMKVAFPTTKDLDAFVGHLQQFGTTQTQVIFSTLVEPRQPIPEED